MAGGADWRRRRRDEMPAEMKRRSISRAGQTRQAAAESLVQHQPRRCQRRLTVRSETPRTAAASACCRPLVEEQVHGLASASDSALT